ncbi:unnamed protein product [Rhizoctonia solani]|uniref:Zn(2)-C6 fungal-type domain-containing protein n=1 Tax=Rhizoctonia solani TaxID=456999 RepID=A0A8H2XFL6_9AGAM|nr:unnamed protein product [Rhizoctonia solani]
MAFARSTTGCLACKARRKKCDETKPHCLRCQKARTECPGYTYFERPNKLSGTPRTLPGPSSRVNQPRASAYQRNSSTNAREPEPQLRNSVPLAGDLVPFDASSSAFGTPVAETSTTLSGAIDISSGTPDQLVIDTTNPVPPPTTATPLTSGQASLLAALLSLGQPPDVGERPRSIGLFPNPNVSLDLNCSAPEIQQEGVTKYEDEVQPGVVSAIRHQPVLDNTLESNALPFVLQGYATWISRLAFEPLKLTQITRDFVLSHFEDGEQSRWIIVLMANIGSSIATVKMVDGKHHPMISALHSAVRQRLEIVKSLPKPTVSELVKALNCALETLVMHFYASPASEVMALRQEAAPIFQQLCPNPPDTPVDLSLLLQHPLVCLRHYAYIDLLFKIVLDIPTLFQYEVPPPASQSSGSSQLVPTIQHDGFLQWRHGIPNQSLLLFAKMISMRSDKFKPNAEKIASLEQDIRDIQPYSGSSSERFVSIMRSVVQECWRQATYVYLHMAVCGDPSDTPRVKEAYKRFKKLLNGTKPGRLPDEFLMAPLLIMMRIARNVVLSLFEAGLEVWNSSKQDLIP